MDTAVMKSWYEVVRRTDPFLWGLALEGTTGLPTPESDIDDLSSLSLPRLEGCHHQYEQDKQLFLSVTSSHSLPETSGESVPSYNARSRDAYCRSLLENSDGQNVFAWLRCLIQPSFEGTFVDKDCPLWNQTKKGLRTLLDTRAHTDFELAEEAIRSKRATGLGIRGTHYPCSQKAMAEALEVVTRTSPPAGIHFACLLPSRSNLHPMWSKGIWMERRENTKERTPSTAVPDLIVSASIPAVADAAVVETETVALNRLGVDQPMDNATANGATGGDHPSLTTPSASSASSNSCPSNLSASPSLSVSATHATCTTTNTIQSTVNNLPNTSNVSTSAKATTNTDVGVSTHSSAVTTLSTISTISTAASASTPASAPTSPPTSTSTSTTTSTPTTPSHKASRLSVLVPSTISPSLIFQAAFDMVHDGLVRSKDATTAFLYRTFSPTYRTTRLYVNSWSNGTQRRGLERIKKSVLRGDAFSLIKGSTIHMKGVWNQIMAAYRVKPSTTTSTGTKLTSSKRDMRGDGHGGSNDKSEKSTSRHRSDGGNNNSSSSSGNNNDGGNSDKNNRTRP
ncbi:hypothetical protein BGX34_008836 [Mortierella sp. NVP85]|nr:hypothetical protein BGX34_008836 [Mortierella sp. NVP85]